MNMRWPIFAHTRWVLALCCLFQSVQASSEDMVKLEKIWIDRTEVTVGAFAEFVDQTNLITQAEASGGGMVYEWGWTQKQDWTWRTPYGAPADPNEPAVHITYDEAEAFCAWSGKRLPTEAEWIEAAYTEQREKPETGFENGITYPFPTGRTPEGANCLEGCGATPNIEVEADLDRGRGHAKVGMTQPGVNGLYDMGANVWEWVQIGDGSNQGTRGGSWWYGVGQMRADHYATKPRDMAAVYIGFRCVRSK